MSALPIRSPHERAGGFVYFGRMLDKLRLHARGHHFNVIEADEGRLPLTARETLSV